MINNGSSYKSDIQDFKSLSELNSYFKNCVSNVYAQNVLDGKLPDIEPLFVYGDGIGNEPVVLIGEAPGKDEVWEGRPFVGAAGKILDDLLIRSGIDRGKLYVTNTVKYRLARQGKKPGTFANRPVKQFEIDCSNQWLRSELAFIKPKLILTLGNTALKGALSCLEYVEFVTGPEGGSSVGDLHGRKFEASIKGSSGNLLLIPLYHPASLIYNRSLRPEYESDLEEVRKCVQSILL